MPRPTARDGGPPLRTSLLRYYELAAPILTFLLVYGLLGFSRYRLSCPSASYVDGALNVSWTGRCSKGKAQQVTPFHRQCGIGGTNGPPCFVLNLPPSVGHKLFGRGKYHAGERPKKCFRGNRNIYLVPDKTGYAFDIVRAILPVSSFYIPLHLTTLRGRLAEWYRDVQWEVITAKNLALSAK
eukprot:3730608-Amphidinium_carterae.6